MWKKITMFFVAGALLMNLYGCFALFAGAAGGAGTAVWLSGKLSENVDASFERSILACESALKSLKLEVTKKTVEQNVAQIMSKYSDGKTIWVDVHRITDKTSKIDVRVGAVKADKDAATKILTEIKRHL